MRFFLLVLGFLCIPSALIAPEITVPINTATPREAALRWINTKVDSPYKWGGNEIKDGGFDCSGITNGALWKFDITDKDLTAAGLATRFPNVSADALRPGDLLFWRSKTGSGKVVHVEMVWEIVEGVVYSIGASGGGPWITTLTAAQRADARVKVEKRETWDFARNPFGD